MTPDVLLPSWRPGSTRDAVVAFLDAAEALPVVERVACFDNDGTLWCERPNYAQLDFFVHALQQRVTDEPTIGEVPEFAALLGGDQGAIGELGLERIAFALVGLFEGVTAEAFTDAVREFMASAEHGTLGRPLRTAVYQPMLELIDELRRREFFVSIVTGGGTEFACGQSARTSTVCRQKRWWAPWSRTTSTAMSPGSPVCCVHGRSTARRTREHPR